MTTSTRTTRAEYVAGLRALADLLDANPDLSLPYATGTSNAPSDRVTFYYLSAAVDAKADLARFARLIPGKVTKEFEDNTLRVAGKLRGLHVEAVAFRSAVCVRVVTGTREVTLTTPAQPATRAVTVTQTIEDVEWVCEPILASVTA